MPPSNLPGAQQPVSRSVGPVELVRQRGSSVAPALRTPDVDAERQSAPAVAQTISPVHVAVSADTDAVAPIASPAGPTLPSISDAIPQRPLSAASPSLAPRVVPPAAEVSQMPAPEPTVAELIVAAEADIRRVIAERERLEQHTAELMRGRKVVEESIGPLQDRLERVSTRLSDIERSEHMANDSATRRANEADRWGIVEERYAIEMELVAGREKLEQVIATITDDEHRYMDLEKEEALLRKRIETLESESKRRELARTLEDATKTRVTIANQIEKLSAERERSHALLSELGRKEAGYESRSGKLGELEAKARSAEELRRLATERYQLEKERHETEMTRWKAEDDIALLETQYQTIADQLAEAEARQIEIERKIRDLTP